MKTKQLRPANIAALALGIVALLLLIVLINQQFSISSLTKQTKKEMESIAKINAELAENRKLENTYRSLSQKLGCRYKNVDWSRHLTYMVNQVNGIMKTYDINIDTLRPSPMRSANGVFQMPLRITFKCKIDGLAKAINDIENTIPKLNVESLDIKPLAEGSDQLQIDMTISSYAIEDKSIPADAIIIKPAVAQVNIKLTKREANDE